MEPIGLDHNSNLRAASILKTISLSLVLFVSVSASFATPKPEGTMDDQSLVAQVPIPSAPKPALSAYLGRTIERGVPLFNQGIPEACASVYATALEAIASSEGWGFDAQQRDDLASMLDVTATIEPPVERAWAYRRIIDTLLSGESLSTPDLTDTRVLFDFSSAQDVERWRIVLDGVMGGRSTGSLEQKQGSMIFSGETSLDNNGGFSSARAPVPAGSLDGYDALRIHVMGDGRTWILGARNRSGMGADSFWTRFKTQQGEWQTVTVPIADMVRQYFGTPISGTLQPSAVRGVEFYIYDKQAGAFRLQVERIEAVRTRS